MTLGFNVSGIQSIVVEVSITEDRKGRKGSFVFALTIFDSRYLLRFSRVLL